MKIAEIQPADVASKLQNLTDKFQPIAPGIGGKAGDLQYILLTLVKIVLDLGVYLFLIVLVISGLMYIYAFGNEDSVGKARKSLIYAFLGFLVFVSVNAGLNFYIQKLSGVVAAGLSISGLVAKIFNLVLIVGGVGFFIVLVYSGIRYFFTGGDEEAAAASRRAIVQAVIGLIIMLAAFAIGEFIIKKVIFP